MFNFKTGKEETFCGYLAADERIKEFLPTDNPSQGILVASERYDLLRRAGRSKQEAFLEVLQACEEKTAVA
jgi:hypothetical protein